jgi:hypothetical protein
LKLDRAKDWSHLLQLKEQRKKEIAAEYCKCAFIQQAKLTDLAHHQYRRLDAELNPSNSDSQRRQEFHESKG